MSIEALIDRQLRADRLKALDIENCKYVTARVNLPSVELTIEDLHELSVQLHVWTSTADTFCDSYGIPEYFITGGSQSQENYHKSTKEERLAFLSAHRECMRQVHSTETLVEYIFREFCGLVLSNNLTANEGEVIEGAKAALYEMVRVFPLSETETAKFQQFYSKLPLLTIVRDVKAQYTY